MKRKKPPRKVSAAQKRRKEEIRSAIRRFVRESEIVQVISDEQAKELAARVSRQREVDAVGAKMIADGLRDAAKILAAAIEKAMAR